MPVRTESVRFRPRAGLVDTIGADLIRDEMAGVVELVKNAYDADARSVTIRFEHLLDPTESAIVIDDDGHGMSRNALLSGWMSPATRLKDVERESPGGRPMLGRKGIGRFSAMRLGDVLILTTTPSKSVAGSATEARREYELIVDWNTFRNTEEYLDDITLELSVRENRNIAERHGTQLRIEQLTDAWDEGRLGRLSRELRFLLSPLATDDAVDFNINIDVSTSDLPQEFLKRLPVKVEPYDIPDVADYKIVASVDSTGRCDYTFRRVLFADADSKELEVADTIPDIMRLFPTDKRPSDDESTDASVDPLKCGAFVLQCAVWDRDPMVVQLKSRTLDSVQGTGVRAIRRFLDEVSGAFIYRDGFRARQETEDWLGLGQRRVQSPTLRLGPNQLFAHVAITSEGNPFLQDKSSREGLKENDAYEHLRLAVLAVLSVAEPIRFRFRKRHGLGRPGTHTTKELRERRKAIVGKLRQALDDTVDDRAARKGLLALVDETNLAVDAEHERLAQQVELLHDTHALGLLARFIIHEGRTLNGALDSAVTNLERRIRRWKGDLQNPAWEQIQMSLLACRESEQRLSRLLNNLDPLTRPRRGRRPRLCLEDVVRKARDLLLPVLTTANVQVVLPRKKHTVLAWEADIFHAFFNMFDNSVYWMRQASGDRKVVIKARSHQASGRVKPKVEVFFKDSGPGVPPHIAPAIFDLGYSEKPDGRGIGLFVAREGIERSRGTLELVEDDVDGATFRIVLEAV